VIGGTIAAAQQKPDQLNMCSAKLVGGGLTNARRWRGGGKA
jgi:hypothetical protein